MKTNNLQDRIRGSLAGGAIGDALGYPIEFEAYESLHSRYGDEGLTRYDVNHYSSDNTSEDNVAIISDDTQMTLFTANGLLNAVKQGIKPKYGICRAYLEWYLTQTGKKSKQFHDCWISDVKRLHVLRAPGNTCLNSLDAIYRGKDPINNSKGCGGVMRVAPIALYAAVDDRMTIMEASLLAGDAAEITHQHPLGFIPAALATHIIYCLVQDEHPTRLAFKNYIEEGCRSMRKLYWQHQNDVIRMEELAERAVMLASYEEPDVVSIRKLGEGWTGEEALAIALYCALAHFDDFRKALAAAVSHSGDSDSTGAVTGNILGAAMGYEAIPEDFKKDLEMRDLILHMADDLCRGEVTKWVENKKT